MTSANSNAKQSNNSNTNLKSSTQTNASKKPVLNKTSKNPQVAPNPSNSRSKSYYDQIQQPSTNFSNSKPTSKLKSTMKPQMSSVQRPGIKPSMKPKNGTSSAPPKPALSYQDILKLADTARKNGGAKPENKSENLGNKHTDLYYNGNFNTFLNISDITRKESKALIYIL